MAETLEILIRETIDKAGPMRVDTYMQLCLAHPEHGYYTGRDPLGLAGDFITAPEISQMFGEIIGAWCANEWHKMGEPDTFTLLECGPGRGTLMADILSATKSIEGFVEAAKITLLEINLVLKARQEEVLRDYSVEWIEKLDTLPSEGPLIVIGNEFLDVLPIRQFRFNGQKWQERNVATEGDRLTWIYQDSNEDLQAQLSKYPVPKKGDYYEFSEPCCNIFKAISRHINNRGGTGLFIDYGYLDYIYGETLQAVKNSRYADILKTSGKADLTAHVNFAMLADLAVGQGLDYAVSTQGDFLTRCGIQYRAQYLMTRASALQRDNIEKALHRLTNSDEMGALFKVMEISKAKTK